MQPNTDTITNYFVHRSAARRYAAARPYFHPLVARRICAVTGVSSFSRALDVACGTGLSSTALAEIAELVEAVDVSPEMVAEARPRNGLHFTIAAAEALPFSAGDFDLATVGLAFHWFEQADFLRQAQRVLAAGAWLVIYTSGFYGEMAENPAFQEWAHQTYPEKFPTPPRRAYSVNPAMVEPLGFNLQETERFEHAEKLTADQLAAFLVTQTNVIAAVEGGAIPLSEATHWIREGIEPYFKGAVQTLKFGGSIAFLRKSAG